MSPELLVPSNSGMERAVLRPESDMYASRIAGIPLSPPYVLSPGPFRGVRRTELGFSVVEGQHQCKPDNASAQMIRSGVSPNAAGTVR